MDKKEKNKRTEHERDEKEPKKKKIAKDSLSSSENSFLEKFGFIKPKPVTSDQINISEKENKFFENVPSKILSADLNDDLDKGKEKT
jgi:hypothetical protein